MCVENNNNNNMYFRVGSALSYWLASIRWLQLTSWRWSTRNTRVLSEGLSRCCHQPSLYWLRHKLLMAFETFIQWFFLSFTLSFSLKLWVKVFDDFEYIFLLYFDNIIASSVTSSVKSACNCHTKNTRSFWDMLQFKHEIRDIYLFI